MTCTSVYVHPSQKLDQWELWLVESVLNLQSCIFLISLPHWGDFFRTRVFWRRCARWYKGEAMALMSQWPRNNSINYTAPNFHRDKTGLPYCHTALTFRQHTPLEGSILENKALHNTSLLYRGRTGEHWRRNRRVDRTKKCTEHTWLLNHAKLGFYI